MVRGLREIMLLVLGIFSFILNFHGAVEGGITREEDLELERQVRLLNRGTIKIVKNKHGEVFNCVDIYKQPAFSHPLLKNHTIQMKPSSFPKGLINEASTSSIPFQKLGLRSGGKRCPQGTVPILRTQKKDLIRAKSFSKRYHANDDRHTSNPTGYHFATTQTASMNWYGGSAIMSIYKPNVTANQFSEALMWVQNGPHDQLNSIQVGSTVNPKLYGDNDPHLFTYWTADGFHQTGCFDYRCPGFIQISKDVTLGAKFVYYSHDTYTFAYHFIVFKDAKTGNWWLTLPFNNVTVGYWPKSLFTSMESYGAEIQWGGEVYNPLNETKPHMGSGYFIPQNPRKTTYARKLQVVDKSNTFIELADVAINTIADNRDCYDVEYYGYKGEFFRYYSMFGGPYGLNCKA